MKKMQYVILNLRSMLKDHSGILLLIIISEILTALCILFSYGLIMKMQDKENESEDLKYYYRFSISGQTGLTAKFSAFFEGMGGDLDKSIDAFAAGKDKNGNDLSVIIGFSYDQPGSDLSSGYCDLNAYHKDLAENDKVILCGEEFRIRNIRPRTERRRLTIIL